MSDPFSNQPPGAFPAPGQTPSAPPPPPGFGQPTYGQAPLGQPVYGQPGGPGPAGPPNFAAGGPGPLVGEPQKPKRSRGKMIGAIVGVVAIVAAGVFAFTQLKSNETSGGAASPEELGQQLTTTLDSEDILGAIDLLLPGERETFRQPMLDLITELKRLQVTDETADLSKLGGFEITIGEPSVDVETTNVDDVAIVSVSADSSVTINGEELPLGEFLLETAFNGERPDLDTDSGDQELNVTFATVQKDGRWYISLFYSAANAIRGDQDIPDEGITPVGASTPEGAVDNMVQAASNLDLEAIIAGLNPNEAEALQRFAPLFLDDAQDSLNDVDMTWKISDVTYSVVGSGNTRQVGIDGFHFEATNNDETIEFDWADGCLVGTSPAGEFDSCTALDDSDGGLEDYLGGFGMTGGSVKQLLDDVGAAFQDFSLHGVVVNEVNGKWYVSPIGSGAETFLSVLRALDRDEIETLINDVGNVSEELNSDIDMSMIPGVIDEDSDDGSDGSDDGSGDGTDSTVVEGASIYWYDCVDQNEAAEDVAACIQAGVDSGDIDPEFVPAPVLFPDCGLSDYYIRSEALYSDDAATFLATIEPGRQCIVDAAAAAGIDLLYSSPEFLYPQCFTMDNPYNYGEENETSGYECAYNGGS